MYLCYQEPLFTYTCVCAQTIKKITGALSWAFLNGECLPTRAAGWDLAWRGLLAAQCHLPIALPHVPFPTLRLPETDRCWGQGWLPCLGLSLSLLDLVHILVSLPKGWVCFQMIFLTCFLSWWGTPPATFRCQGEKRVETVSISYRCRSRFQQSSLKAERSLPGWQDQSNCSSISISSFFRLPNAMLHFLEREERY